MYIRKKLSHSDKIAILFFGLIILVSAVLIPFLADEDYAKSKEKADLDKDSYGQKDYTYAQPGENDGSVPADVKITHLQYFDPNTADSTVLLGLGLKPWQVRSIYKYRAKGGRYYVPEDFAGLYGLTLKHYKILRPYIRIKGEPMARDVIKRQRVNYADNRNEYAGNEYHKDNANHKAEINSTGNNAYSGIKVTKIRYGEKIDINKADTTELKKIPGIGSYFARRIVELRSRRGAFVTPDELMDIRNFPETSLEYMSASQNFPVIAINEVSQKTLERHPLINHTQASDIMQLRRTRGRITSVKDMAFISSFTEAQLKRLSAYLKF